jgi:hypothetical protein
VPAARPRRLRRRRHALTVERELALLIGPRHDDEIEALRPIFTEYRHRFHNDDWGVRYFEHGLDDRDAEDEDVSNDRLAPGLPGV